MAQQNRYRVVVAGMIAFLVASTAFAGGRGESEPEETKRLVFFFPFGNTSTPEAVDAVEEQLEAQMARDDLLIDLDWIIIARQNHAERRDAILASGKQLDGGVGNAADFWELRQRPGLVRPVGDLLQEHGKNLLETVPQSAWDAATGPQGETSGIPSFSRYYWNGALIREDWLEQLNLELPDTIKELEQTMEAFRTNYENIIPAGGQSWYLEPFLMSAVTGNVTPNFEWETVTDDNRVVQAFTHPAFKKFLELYNRWIDAGWWNEDFLVTDDQQNEQLFLSGRMGILFTDPHSAVRYNRLIQVDQPGAKITFLPVPSGPAGGPAFPFHAGTGRFVWIAQGATNPEAVVQYFDWLVADSDHYRLARLGIEGEHWVNEGESWSLPDEAQGDPSRREYADIFAPLAYESFHFPRSDIPDEFASIDEYYAGVPAIMPTLFGFDADWEEIGDVETMDIWEEMYKIAVGARPLDEYEQVVDEYYANGGSEIYATMTEQYRGWTEQQN